LEEGVVGRLGKLDGSGGIEADGGVEKGIGEVDIFFMRSRFSSWDMSRIGRERRE
jgi:hypothetical protein